MIRKLSEKILNEIGHQNVTFTSWAMGFVGILFIRFLFESFSSPTNTGIIRSDPFTIIHYLLFYLCLSLGTSLIFGYFIKDHVSAPKILLFGLPLLWLAPVVDITLSRGHGYTMSYIFDSGSRLIFDFFTFFGTNFTFGATYGMRIGIALTIIGLGYCIWLRTKNMLRSFLGAFLIYSLIFVTGSLPGIFYTFSHIQNQTSTNTEVVSYFEKTILKSTIAHNTLREGISSVSKQRFLELGFDKLLSQILFILSCIFGGLLFWKMDDKKFLVIVKNIRTERANFYIASLMCGLGFAYINGLGNKFVWIDLFGIICLIISWTSLWMHAVHTNDIIDIDIDKISNTERPLVKKYIDVDDMKDIGNTWLAVALLGSWSVGYYPFFMSLVYVACSYIYSSPPLRLRRFPIIPSFLIAVACLATILAGFFFVSIHKELQFFPTLLALGIIIMVTLAINFKDVKDIEGDKANGILTIPTLFPKNGVRIVAILFALSILLVPIFLSFYFLYIFAVPCSIVGYKLIVKKPYREKPIFVLRFIFLASIAISYLGIYWIAYTYNLI